MYRRLLHTMLRVGNLDVALNFYCGILGMRELRRFENKEYGYTLVFVGYEDESEGCCLELTYNYDRNEYDNGDRFGHIAIGVDDCYGVVEQIRGLGGIVTREAGPLKGGGEVIAFCEDFEGNKVELIERDLEWFSRGSSDAGGN